MTARHEITHPRFANLGDFLLGVAADEHQRLGNAVANPRAVKLAADLQAAAGSDEHALSFAPVPVPTNFSDALLARAFDFSRVASRCTRLPIAGDGLRLPAFHESSRVDGARLGGVASYWTSETTSPASGRAKFQAMNQTTHTLCVTIPASEELIGRAPSLGATLQQAAAEEIAVALDSAIIAGNSTGKPTSLTTSAAVVEVPKESGQTAATIVRENVVKMLARLWPYSDAKAVWFCSRSAQQGMLTPTQDLGDLLRFYDRQGPDGATMSLAGIPLIVLEQCPPIGTPGDLILADMSQYALGDRGQVKNADSMHVRFDAHERLFKFWYEVDGRPTWLEPVAAMNGTDGTQSPFVRLAERA